MDIQAVYTLWVTIFWEPFRLSSNKQSKVVAATLNSDGTHVVSIIRKRNSFFDEKLIFAALQ